MGFSGELADRVAIAELNSTYGHCVSSHDADGLEVLFAEESEWQHPYYGVVKGARAIRDALAAAMDDYPVLVFFPHVGALEISGDRATGSVYVNELAGKHGEPVGRVTGRYDDRYVRLAGRWLFEQRIYHVYHSGLA